MGDKLLLSLRGRGLGRGLGRGRAGRRFEPYRRRPCGVTRDLFPNSRGNKAAAKLRLEAERLQFSGACNSREPGTLECLQFSSACDSRAPAILLQALLESRPSRPVRGNLECLDSSACNSLQIQWLRLEAEPSAKGRGEWPCCLPTRDSALSKTATSKSYSYISAHPKAMGISQPYPKQLHPKATAISQPYSKQHHPPQHPATRELQAGRLPSGSKTSKTIPTAPSHLVDC